MTTSTEMPGAHPEFVPFRLLADARRAKLAAFHARPEIAWFGFEGRFEGAATSVISIARPQPGWLGGGGTDALNGGVIAAGFDAAFVLAGLGHYEADVMVTLALSTHFLSLARVDRPLAFRAGITRSSRAFAFAEGALGPVDASATFATATAMLAPASGGVRP